MAHRTSGTKAEAADGAPSLKAGASPGEATAESILLVAERLFAERGYRHVAVRDIAAEAGVTHPLIYHYWGSKRGLMGAVLERTQASIRATPSGSGDERAELLALVRDYVAGRRLFVETMVRAFLDGMPAEEWPGGFPGIERALTLLGVDEADDETPRSTDARRQLAAATAMLFGWILLEDHLLAVVGLSASDLDAAREELVAAFDRVVQPAFETPGE